MTSGLTTRWTSPWPAGLALTGLALAAAPPAHAQAKINIPYNGYLAGYFGVTSDPTQKNTAVYGQTFVTPDATNTALDNFTFYFNGPTTETFQGYVYAYDDTTNVVTGPALYTSPVMNFSGSGKYDPVTLNTGGIHLTPGTQYVTFLSVDPVYGSSTGRAAVEANQNNNGTEGYSKGFFVFQNNNGDASDLSNPQTPFGSFASYYSLAFTANFSPTPEPSQLAPFALLGLALGGLMLRARRRA